MLRNETVASMINFLFIVIGCVFYTLAIGLYYESLGWFQSMNEMKLAGWAMAVIAAMYISSFIWYDLRPVLLLFWLIASLVLVQYPLVRKAKDSAPVQEPPIEKHD